MAVVAVPGSPTAPTDAGADADAAWCAGLSARSATLVVDGPPGCGKSHRLAALVAAAAAHDVRVLRARPSPSETLLIGSALLDLFDTVTDAELADLPRAQADALAAAVLRREGPAGGLTPQAVVFAFTGLVRALSAVRPLLLVVDDLQWLDAQTATVLAFAARRLPPAGVGLVVALRTSTVPEPEVVAAMAEAAPRTRVTIAPLPDDRIEQIIRTRVGPTLTTRGLRTAVGLAGGNPLFAIEVGRSLRDRPPLGDGPSLPATLADLVGHQIEVLPPTGRTGLAAVAALRRPSLGQLDRLGLAGGVADAERAGLVRVEGHVIAFVHPLYAAAAYESLTGSERTRLHARLAEVVAGTEERARHLALGSETPDEDVAQALDLARDQAMRRGALHAAVDACRLSLRATPADSPLGPRRRTHLGRLLYRVGESVLAKEELGRAAADAREPHVRARALHELARIVGDTESEPRAAEIELAALPLAAGDPSLEADIHTGLAVCRVDDWRVAVDHARTALRLLEADPATPPQKTATALTSLAIASFYAGYGADLDACRRAVALEGDACDVAVGDRAICVLAYLSMWVDDHEVAAEQLQRAHELSVSEGDEASRVWVLSQTALLSLRRGDWARAAACIAEQEQMCERFHNEYFGRAARLHAAWLAAYRGDLATAMAQAEDDIATGVTTDSPLVEQRGRGLAGFCALAAGDVVRAADDLTRYTELFAAVRADEPALRQLAADHVEALVATHRLDEARAALAAMRAPAERLHRASVLAAGLRVEALLLAAEGDLPAALVAADAAVAAYASLPRPLDRARALLGRGRLRRRARQKAAARDDLVAAVAAFEVLGAAGFAAIARADLARTGLRPPASTDLTETERRIADLAATGLTSAEIATTLFLSTKTVSANLTRVYRKLGVRNRSEMVAMLAAPDVPGRAGSSPP